MRRHRRAVSQPSGRSPLGCRRTSRVAVALVGIVFALVPGPAHAQGADAQGWWNEFHQSGQPAPPAPPDVGADDLLLQGGDPGRLLASDQPPAPSALGALRFQVAPGAEVGALVLQVGAGAQAADVRAYPTSSAWKAVQDGPIKDAPVPDFARFSTGRLSADGATLTFPDIGRLVTEGGLLSVVLLPGAADRVVVHKPAPTALAVAAPAPAAEVSPSPASPAATAAPAPEPVAAAPLVGGFAPPLAVASDQPVAPAVVSPGVVPQPVAAAPATTTARVTRRIVPDDNRGRLAVAVEALLVLVFFGLLGQGPLAVLARLTGAGEAAAVQRGVGRFTAARVGLAPRL